jgi:hypothetical protein
MNFQPIGASGTTEISDCKRYMVTRAWNTERWDAWLQATEGPNTKLAKNLPDKDAARKVCVDHLRALTAKQLEQQNNVRTERTAR